LFFTAIALACSELLFRQVVVFLLGELKILAGAFSLRFASIARAQDTPQQSRAI